MSEKVRKFLIEITFFSLHIFITDLVSMGCSRIELPLSNINQITQPTKDEFYFLCNIVGSQKFIHQGRTKMDFLCMLYMMESMNKCIKY